MAAPTSLLRGARAFSRDISREIMPPGYLWDVCDYVPLMIDTLLTSRGAWVWGGGPFTGDVQAGILATFTSGEQLLVADTPANRLYEINPNAPYDSTYRGEVPGAAQNPVMLFDQVIWPDGTGSVVPYIVGSTGAPTPIAAANVPHVRVGTIWGEYFVGANQVDHENTVYWSAPDDVTLPWDPNSFVETAGTVTGLAALRTIILVFHAASIERIRGTRPPAGTDKGDLILEPLFQQVGTTEPKTICYWQENVLFADEHGVQITDGATLRNLVQQGSIQSYWRNLYNHKTSLSATVFLDYYIVSVNRDDGVNDTLVCDLNARQWFRFSNIPALSMWASGGTIGMERIWAGMLGTSQIARLSPCFFPAPTGTPGQDADGTYVLPSFETAYYKMAPEGRKRVRFVYMSYDARLGGGELSAQPAGWQQRLRAEEFSNGIGVQPQAAGDVLQVNYILSPQDVIWTTAGTYPPTTDYSRYRLPVGKAPYGIAFQVKQIAPTTVTRVSDLSVDVHVIDRGRI